MAFLGGGVLVLAAILTLLPSLGRPGRAVADALSRAPLLDAAMSLLTWVPWVVGAVVWGWLGLAGALAGQVLAYFVWVTAHELAWREETRGPRIVKFVNRAIGRWRNHTALWATMIALPILWAVRLGEAVAYPFLVWFAGFPRYRHGEWVNLTRHKFRGLVGHDLFWCLYCDWMTGVYSLGADMLRNVESFWCPIRFGDEAKNRHTRSVFPDVDLWVPGDGTMEDVEELMDCMYADGQRSWFGHPERMEALKDAGGGPEMLDSALLAHSRDPHNRGELPGHTHSAEGEMPLCGDAIRVELRVEDGRIAAARWSGPACPVCAASASIMTEAIKGRSLVEARSLFRQARRLAIGGRPHPGEEDSPLAPIAAVRRAPARINCALLPWHTMRSALGMTAVLPWHGEDCGR